MPLAPRTNRGEKHDVGDPGIRSVIGNCSVAKKNIHNVDLKMQYREGSIFHCPQDMSRTLDREGVMYRE